MNIVFASRKLQRAFEGHQEAVRRWGERIGIKFVQRIVTLQSARRFEELYTLKSLRVHQLKGGRKGEYAIDLTGNWRLIIEPVDQETVLIKEVVDYHGD